MAGSYEHAVNEQGQLRTPENLKQMLEKPNDWVGFAEEAYGMIWWLADTLYSETGFRGSREEFIEAARQRYVEGMKASPGWETSGTELK